MYSMFNSCLLNIQLKKSKNLWTVNYTRTQAKFQEEEANHFVERENSLFFFKNVKITYKIPKEQLFGGFDLICINIPMHRIYRSIDTWSILFPLFDRLLCILLTSPLVILVVRNSIWSVVCTSNRGFDSFT